MGSTSSSFGIATVRREDGTVAVSPAGEIDVYTSPRLRERLEDLLAAECPRLVLDLGEVPFIDSSGLGVLVTVHKRARARGAAMSVVNLRPPVRRVMEIAGIFDVLEVEPG